MTRASKLLESANMYTITFTTSQSLHAARAVNKIVAGTGAPAEVDRTGRFISYKTRTFFIKAMKLLLSSEYSDVIDANTKAAYNKYELK